MLAERSAQQTAVFREGIEAVYASDPLELLERARAIRSASNEALTTLSAAALRRAAAHRYRERAQEILDTAMLGSKF